MSTKYGPDASIFRIYDYRPDDKEIEKNQSKIQFYSNNSDIPNNEESDEEIEKMQSNRLKYAIIWNHSTKKMYIIEFYNIHHLLDDVLTKYGHDASIFRIYDYRPDNEEIIKIRNKLQINSNGNDNSQYEKSDLDDLNDNYLPKIDPRFIPVYNSVKSSININHEIEIRILNTIEHIKRSITVLFSLAVTKRMNIQFFTYQKNYDVDPELMKSLKFFLNAINLTLRMFDNLINVVLIITD